MSDKFAVFMLHRITMRFWIMYVRETPREGEVLWLKDESFRVDRVTRVLNDSGDLIPNVFLDWANTEDLQYDAAHGLVGWRMDQNMGNKE
jgi:hypothetical protein